MGQATALASKVSKLVVQGAWSRVKKEEEADKMWRSMIWGMPSHICRFATQAALDILPTHANLTRWRAPVGAACVCGLRDTVGVEAATQFFSALFAPPKVPPIDLSELPGHFPLDPSSQRFR